MDGRRRTKVNPHHKRIKKDVISSIATFSSLLTLPADLWRPVVDNKINTSITSVGSETDNLKVMSRLSQTCKSFYQFFKPELDKRAAKQLLEYVLQGNEERVVRTAKTNPRVFFIKATAQDYAMDLKGNRRTIKDWSPYQAIFGTGDKEMLRAVKSYLDAYLETQDHGYKLAAKQEREKFPSGFSFPPCTDVFNQLLDELTAAITNDKTLRQTGYASDATLNLLAQFRKHLVPSVVETGHHFNMNQLIKTHDVYEQQWHSTSSHSWSGNQFAFFCVKVIGFQQRLMTAPYLQAACMGLKKYVGENQPLWRSFKAMSSVSREKIIVVPFIADHPFRHLGKDIFLDSYRGSWHLTYLSMINAKWATERLCRMNTDVFSRLMHKSKKRAEAPCLIT